MSTSTNVQEQGSTPDTAQTSDVAPSSSGQRQQQAYLSKFPSEHPSETKAVATNKVARWMELFDKGLDNGFKQMCEYCPKTRSGQSLSTQDGLNGEPPITALKVSKDEYMKQCKSAIYSALIGGPYSWRADREWERGSLQHHIDYRSETQGTDLAMKTTLTFPTGIFFDDVHKYILDLGTRELKFEFSNVGRSYRIATNQGIRDFCDRLVGLGTDENLAVRIRNDLTNSLLDNPQTVPKHLVAIEPVLSDLHLSIKLRQEAGQPMSALATFKGSTWDNKLYNFVPISVDNIKKYYEPEEFWNNSYKDKPDKVQLEVQLQTAQGTDFRVPESVVNNPELFKSSSDSDEEDPIAEVTKRFGSSCLNS